MVHAILFDLDNTLADRSFAHRRYCEEFARRFLSDWPERQQRRAIGEMVDHDDFGYSDRIRYCEWLASRFPRTGLSGDAIWKDYRALLPGLFRPTPSVDELIERLESRFVLAVVTNGSSAGQRAKLARTRLAGRFQHVIISGECGFEKPSPKIFHRALAAAGCEAGDAMFVGDDPVRDVQGAAAVGMTTCWVSGGRDFPGQLRPPDRIITSLREWEGP